MSLQKKLEKKLREAAEKHNSTPLDDFLGLSPAQMREMFYAKLDNVQHIVHFNSSFDPTLLSAVPVVTKIMQLLKFLDEVGEAKATQNGFSAANYATLLKYWISAYNWAFADRLDECPIIREAALFSLYMLRQKAQTGVTCEELGKLFLRAFPVAVEEIQPDPFNTSPAVTVSRIFTLRFIERFAADFGLVDCVRDYDLPYFESYDHTRVTTTKLFFEALLWFQPDKQEQPISNKSERHKDEWLH